MTAVHAMPSPRVTHEAATCAHCNDPVPLTLQRSGDEHQFCCSGCRGAFELIRGCGLERYYALREREAGRSATRLGSHASSERSARGFEEFDDPAFLALYTKDVVSATQSSERVSSRRVELTLQGLHCSACVWLLEKLPAVVAGVHEARLDVRRATIAVSWNPQRVSLSVIAQALDTLGYKPHPPSPATSARAHRVRVLDDRAMLVKLGVAGALASNVMLLALALYAGALQDMDPAHVQLLRWLSMGLSVLSMLWPGWVFIRGALASLRARMLTLDVPIAAGLLAGTVWGVVNTVRGVGDIYFDSVSVLIFFLLISRYIQQRQQRFAADSVELLFSLTPSTAQLVTSDGVRDVPIARVREGDIVQVLAGASVPVDGVIIVGSSNVDRSLLTGESQPVPVGVGDACEAGTVNLASPLRVRVCATGEATRVGRLMKLVEEGSRSKAPFIQWADRLAGHFIFVMLIMGALTVALWTLADPANGLSRGITNAVALLVVTCPCGLGLATPLVMTMAMGRAARSGILTKHAAAIELLASPRSRHGTRIAQGTLLLDKTGTLTEGRTRLVRVVVSCDLPAALNQHWLLAACAALEQTSTHHIAKALVEASASRDLPTPRSTREAIGQGVEGVVDDPAGIARHVRIGREQFACEAHAPGDRLAQAAAAALRDGLTPVFISVDRVPSAVCAVGDALRSDARDVVSHLRGLGWHVRLLSGDHPAFVHSIASELDLPSADALGGLAPEDKLRVVLAANAHGPVVMVGDGVNDAPALAAATVGIAVKGGAEASLAATDVYLTQSGLTPLRALVQGAERTMRVIRLCVLVSVLYNIVAAGLSITGIITPLLAAIVMPMASLSVLVIALRGRTFADAAAAPVKVEKVFQAGPDGTQERAI